MALEFCDSFQHYSSFTPKWTSYGSVTLATATPRYAGGTYATTSNYPSLYKAGLTNSSTYWLGVAFRWGGVNDITPLFSVFEDGNRQVQAVVDGSGMVKFHLAGSGENLGSVIATTASGLLVSGVWNYLEMKITIHSSAGVIEFRKNGETVYSGTSLNTMSYGSGIINGVAPFMTQGNASRGAGSSVMDFYACSDTGSDNKGFLGDIRVQAILPSGAGNSTQMTPSAGSNYQCVDEAAPNDDTDYVSETTAGEKDTYAFGDLTPTSGTVKGTQILISARKDDAGTRTIAPVYRPVSTDYDGTTVSIGNSYDYVRQVKDVSPATSVAWTIAEINGAEFGVKLVS